MYDEIVGNDAKLVSYSSSRKIKVESDTLDAQSNVDSLLGKLIEMCNQPVPSPKIEENLCKNSYFQGLQAVFVSYKKDLDLSFAENEMIKLQEQSSVLDKSLDECISNIVNTEKEDSDMCVAKAEESITDAYENLSESIELLNTEIWNRRAAMQSLLNRHQKIRPISNLDLENMTRCFKIQQIYWANQLKTQICNFSMMTTSYLFRQQRRRNFPKKAARILNDYFEAHMNHPYPDEQTKLRLAKVCGLNVAQVSNWFGNKRIRFKKSLERKSEDKEC